MTADRTEIARAMYRAYETGEREVLDEVLRRTSSSTAPPDPGIDLEHVISNAAGRTPATPPVVRVRAADRKRGTR